MLRFSRLFIMRYTDLACLCFYDVAFFNDIRHFTDNFSFGSPLALRTSLEIFLKIETVQMISHVFSSHVMSCCCQYKELQFCRKNLIIFKELLRFRWLGSPYISAPLTNVEIFLPRISLYEKAFLVLGKKYIVVDRPIKMKSSDWFYSAKWLTVG